MEKWHDHALCRGVSNVDRNFDRFFPTNGSATEKAIPFCSGCPVRAECLDFAIRERIIDGIWGGLTGTQRETLRKKRGGKARIQFEAELAPTIAEVAELLVS
jgi:WhiB family redox-sensing transcriptional regulator